MAQSIPSHPISFPHITQNTYYNPKLQQVKSIHPMRAMKPSTATTLAPRAAPSRASASSSLRDFLLHPRKNFCLLTSAVGQGKKWFLRNYLRAQEIPAKWVSFDRTRRGGWEFLMTVPIRCVVVVEVCGGESAQEVRNGFAKARAHLGRKKIVVVHAHIPSSQSVHRALTELCCATVWINAMYTREIRGIVKRKYPGIADSLTSDSFLGSFQGNLVRLFTHLDTQARFNRGGRGKGGRGKGAWSSDFEGLSAECPLSHSKRLSAVFGGSKLAETGDVQARMRGGNRMLLQNLPQMHSLEDCARMYDALTETDFGFSSLPGASAWFEDEVNRAMCRSISRIQRQRNEQKGVAGVCGDPACRGELVMKRSAKKGTLYTSCRACGKFGKIAAKFTPDLTEGSPASAWVTEDRGAVQTCLPNLDSLVASRSRTRRAMAEKVAKRKCSSDQDLSVYFGIVHKKLKQGDEGAQRFVQSLSQAQANSFKPCVLRTRPNGRVCIVE